jgi:hypothetical protein
MKPIIVLLLGILFHNEVFAQGGSQEIEAKGLGAILGGDRAAARDKAIKDAQRNAVEQAVGTMISAETKVENFQLISDRILTESTGYLQQYEVMNEQRVDSLTYEVVIRAVVKIGNLKNDLSSIGLCYEFVGKPRMMVLIREQNGRGMGTSVELNTAETAIIDTFLKVQRKFIFVDERTAKQNLNLSQARAAFDGDNAVAAALARTAAADIIIVGEAEAKAVSFPALGTMKSGQANISARVIYADNGVILTTKDAHAAAPHIDEMTARNLAIKKASLQLAGALMQPIIEGWCKVRTSGQMIQLVIRNIREYEEVLNLEGDIQNHVRGIRVMHQRSFDAGVAVYDVESETDAKEMARELTLKEIGAFKIKILNVSPGRIEVKVERKQEP